MNRTSKLHLLRALLVVAPMLVLTSCGGSDSPGPTGPGPNPNPNPAPTTGFIQVTTATTGADLDPDGYMADMDGNGGRSIGLNGVTTFTDVPTGEHQVQLTGLAENCLVTGTNPATVSVTAGATVQVSFDVACEATTGSIELTIATTNNFDPDGYRLLLDGTVASEVMVNTTVTIDGVAPGDRSLELADIAPNCVTEGENPVTLAVAVGSTAAAGFSVTCMSPPDGRIAFNSFRNSRIDVYVANTDGTGILNLTTGSGSVFNHMPSWSPDGSHIAFTWDEAGVGTRINVMRVDGSELTQTTAPGTTANDFGPVWSPDGTRLAFTRSVDGQQNDIYAVDVDGRNLTQLTTHPAWDAFPAWSPDGSRIVFASSRDLGDFEGCDLYVLELASGTTTRLTNTLDDGMCEQEPAWSPDGTQIAFAVASISVEKGIEVMNADGTGRTRLANESGWPRWSPDGFRIVFTCNDTPGDSDICVVGADGGGRLNITNTPSTLEDAPDWGP